MSNIRVDVGYTIHDGSELKFRSPASCSAITGLIVYYPGTNGNITSNVFALADAHGNNVGDIDHLFAENVVVKVILDVTTGMAFVQNADTNAYIEDTFLKKTGGTVNGEFKVGANGVTIWESTYEGGNLRLKPPADKTADYWEMDAYDGNLRFHTQKNATDPDGAGSKTALKLNTDGSISVGNISKTLSNLGALPTAGGTMNGAINMNGKIIHGLPDVTGKDQPVTLNYLEPRYWNSGQVWNNAAGSSNFGAQKVSVNLSAYGAVLIFFKHAHETGFVSEFGIKNQKSVVTRGGFTAKDGKYYIATYRDFSVSDSGVTFSAGFASQNNADATEQNWALIPFLILGLRGLS
ncbi:MAG: hypothetical protein J6Q53_04400 [Oscillospiraceae bacterium]|nr:hypothetical protein [Oscillospiraceae bacterium]